MEQMRSALTDVRGYGSLRSQGRQDPNFLLCPDCFAGARNDKLPHPASLRQIVDLATQARTSASTSGSTALTSCTVMPALMRGS